MIASARARWTSAAVSFPACRYRSERVACTRHAVVGNLERLQNREPLLDLLLRSRPVLLGHRDPCPHVPRQRLQVGLGRRQGGLRESGRLRGAPCGGFRKPATRRSARAGRSCASTSGGRTSGSSSGRAAWRSSATRRRIPPAPARRTRWRSRRCSVMVRASMRRCSVPPSPHTARGRRRNPGPPYAATLRGRRRATVHCRSSRRSPFRRAAAAPARRAGPSSRSASIFPLSANMGTMMLVDSFSFGMPASMLSRASA